MKKWILGLSMMVGLVQFSYGQQYNTAIGFKGGYPGYGSLSIKHFLGGGSGAIEGNFGGGPHHLIVQGLFERNTNIEGGLDWYWGLGGHLGFWSNGYNYYHRKNDTYYNGTWGGVDGVLGLEYTFNQIPLNLAVDMGPTLQLFPYVGVGFGGALALRFAIK